MKMIDVAREMFEAGASGFRVSWEWRETSALRMDMTPDRDEPPFRTEEAAWRFAEVLAARLAPRICNVYVVDAKTFVPVKGYEKRRLLA